LKHKKRIMPYLSAGKTKPTIGTKIEGKNAAAIFLS
jgi:hypothetical protein